MRLIMLASASASCILPPPAGLSNAHFGGNSLTLRHLFAADIRCVSVC